MRWSYIKALFGNPVIKISYVVVLGLPITIGILRALKITPNMPSVIYEVFYSSTLIIASFLLYSIAAPAEIKNYTDIHDYVNKHKPDLLNAVPDNKKEIVMAHLDASQNERKSEIENLHQLMCNTNDLEKKEEIKKQLDSIIEPIFPGSVTRFLQTEWYVKDTKKNFVALALCFILNFMGSVLALFVFYERIKIVLENNVSK